MNKPGTLIGVVIPARNEERTVARVVLSALKHWSYVIVVDDDSEDGTALAAAKAGARIVTHQVQMGYGGAVRSGLREAAVLGIDTVVLLDADGAHNPDESPELVAEHIRVGADLTIGSRFHDGVGEWFPTTKRDANRFGRTIFNAVHNSALTDVASGYRVLGRRILSAGLEQVSFAAAFELIANALATDCKVHEAPISIRYDASEPFCTGRGELRDFLGFCSEGAQGALREDLLALLVTVKQARSCVVAAGEDMFNLHFVAEYDAYMIQQQNPWFSDVRQRENPIKLRL